MHLPSTRTLQAFVTAAQLGSLAAASARVAMSVPALSRRLAGLEKELGIRLFERVPRGVVLTTAGNSYLAHAVAVLDRLQVAAADLQRDTSLVRVTTIPAFATRWLLPRLPAFSARYPGIDVEVRTSIAFERLDTGEYDFAIRLALDHEMTTAPLLPIHLMPVWSAAHPRAITHPDDVMHHPLLGPDHRPEFWEEWMRGVGLEYPGPRPREIDALLLYERVLSGAGAGVAIGIEPLTSALLGQERLKGLDTYRLRSERSFFLIEPTEIRTRAARLFRGWLQGEAQG
ncbi:LysR substrate-binding domain-containing protein [Sphingomonas albertensis]|uniref:LysR family transcriptional regulator n=2 Tax=Sphingomonas albertensis TaxID=2762591 RepID=A0ABR7AI35_9SPHN|nr:LysR family transcriptional regulator [Sphingomonas albertensis]